MRPHEISIADVEYVAFKLAKLMFEWDEPIPAFGTRFPDKLESCLAAPFQKYDKKYLYHGLLRKAAMLFYLMVKNHPFQNGNKRIAMTTLLVFLHDNKRWLRVPHNDLYDFALSVAASEAREKDRTIVDIEGFIKKYLIVLSP